MRRSARSRLTRIDGCCSETLPFNVCNCPTMVLDAPGSPRHRPPWRGILQSRGLCVAAPSCPIPRVELPSRRSREQTLSASSDARSRDARDWLSWSPLSQARELPLMSPLRDGFTEARPVDRWRAPLENPSDSQASDDCFSVPVRSIHPEPGAARCKGAIWAARRHPVQAG